jgi:ribonuclease HI
MHSLNLYTDGSIKEVPNKEAISAFILTNATKEVLNYSRVSYTGRTYHDHAIPSKSNVAELFAFICAYDQTEEIISSATELLIHTDCQQLISLITAQTLHSCYFSKLVSMHLSNLRAKGVSGYAVDCQQTNGLSEHYHVHNLAKRSTQPPAVLDTPLPPICEAPTHVFKLYLPGMAVCADCIEELSSLLGITVTAQEAKYIAHNTRIGLPLKGFIHDSNKLQLIRPHDKI